MGLIMPRKSPLGAFYRSPLGVRFGYGDLSEVYFQLFGGGVEFQVGGQSCCVYYQDSSRINRGTNTKYVTTAAQAGEGWTKGIVGPFDLSAADLSRDILLYVNKSNVSLMPNLRPADSGQWIELYSPAGHGGTVWVYKAFSNHSAEELGGGVEVDATLECIPDTGPILSFSESMLSRQHIVYDGVDELKFVCPVNMPEPYNIVRDDGIYVQFPLFYINYEDSPLYPFYLPGYEYQRIIQNNETVVMNTVEYLGNIYEKSFWSIDADVEWPDGSHTYPYYDFTFNLVSGESWW